MGEPKALGGRSKRHRCEAREEGLPERGEDGPFSAAD